VHFYRYATTSQINQVEMGNSDISEVISTPAEMTKLMFLPSM